MILLLLFLPFIYKPIKVSLLSFFLFLGPVLGFFQSGYFSHGDRWSYLSTLGFYILFGGCVFLFWDRLGMILKRLMIVVFLCLLCGSFFLSQNSVTNREIWPASYLKKESSEAYSTTTIIRQTYYPGV